MLCANDLCLGSTYSTSYQTNCPQDFKQYDDRSCFKLFNHNHSHNFQQGSTYCHTQCQGKLLTISNPLQHNRTLTYIKLYGNSQSYWIGLIYRNNSAGEVVLMDVDGNPVDASKFGLGSVKPTIGNCVSMTYSDEKLKFVSENCSILHDFVCLVEWPGM